MIILASTREWNSGINDGNHVYNYFKENGAKIWTVNTSLRSEHGRRKYEDLEDFLRSRGNNKLLSRGRGPAGTFWQGCSSRYAMLPGMHLVCPSPGSLRRVCLVCQ